MEYKAHVSWQSGSAPFAVKTFDRSHHIQFGGGIEIGGSSAPEFLGNAQLVNPEELFTASIASCFMLTFLYWAALKNLAVANYECDAIGKLGKNAEGKMAMTEVRLRPQIQFSETEPDAALLQELFHKAHEQCFISCSVKTAVIIEA